MIALSIAGDSEMKLGFFGIFPGEKGLSIVVEDDGRVCFGYMRLHRWIISDVWLYNVLPAPVRPPWTEPDRLELAPFLNSAEFCLNVTVRPAQDGDVSVEWEGDNDSICARLLLRGELHASMRPYEKPGCCVLALKDGPLARVLKK